MLTPYESNENSPMISDHLLEGLETASMAFISSGPVTYSASDDYSLTADSDIDVKDVMYAKITSVSDPCGSTLSMRHDDMQASQSLEGEMLSIDEDIHRIAYSYQENVGLSNLNRATLEYALQTKRNGVEPVVFTESNSGDFVSILRQEGIMSVPLSESGFYVTHTHIHLGDGEPRDIR